MKRFVLGIGLALAATSAAYAECDTGSSEVMQMTDWSLEYTGPDTPPGVSVVTEFTYTGDRAFRMIEADGSLDDVLGRYVFSFRLDPDLKAQPGEEIVYPFGPMGTDAAIVERVMEINPDDVVAEICVQSIVYEDGTVERFD